MIAAHRVLPDVVAEIIRRQPLSSEKVTFAWRTAVGAAVARVSTVHLDADGTLRVRVDDPRWTREIERARDLISARLGRLLGPDFQRIEIRLAGARFADPETRPRAGRADP
jgi:Dna[CI] antecedent, DciA